MTDLRRQYNIDIDHGPRGSHSLKVIDKYNQMNACVSEDVSNDSTNRKVRFSKQIISVMSCDAPIPNSCCKATVVTQMFQLYECDAS